MSMLDLFKAKQYKEELEQTKKSLEELKAKTPKELLDILDLQKKLEKLNTEIKEKESKITAFNNQILDLKNEIVTLEDEFLFQSFGLYKPRYAFATSDVYKDKLAEIRNKQKDAIKNNYASTGSNTNWTVNGSAKEGNAMVKDMQKLLIRAYNSECDEVIDRVKFNNVEASVKKIEKSRNTLSKLGKPMGVVITEPYHQFKIEELYLAHEYALKKQEEKEEQKHQRELLREQEKLEKEIEIERKKIAKEQTHYNNQYNTILNQLKDTNLSDETKQALESKKVEIENQLAELDKSIKNIDYRVANQKAGYVYVISNLGAFGENIYKIGMTRRLEPMDRINELGDASVPFDFDVHAMIFSDNAPALEASLHKAFESKKVNMVNSRREFFDVSLDEIESVVKANYDKTVEFIKTPDAEQYRESIKIKETLSNNK